MQADRILAMYWYCFHALLQHPINKTPVTRRSHSTPPGSRVRSHDQSPLLITWWGPLSWLAESRQWSSMLILVMGREKKLGINCKSHSLYLSPSSILFLSLCLCRSFPGLCLTLEYVLYTVQLKLRTTVNCQDIPVKLWYCYCKYNCENKV